MPTERFQEPTDAREQVTRGLDVAERLLGRRPTGMWPGEGAVAQEVMSIFGRRRHRVDRHRGTRTRPDTRNGSVQARLERHGDRSRRAIPAVGGAAHPQPGAADVLPRCARSPTSSASSTPACAAGAAADDFMAGSISVKDRSTNSAKPDRRWSPSWSTARTPGSTTRTTARTSSTPSTATSATPTRAHGHAERVPGAFGDQVERLARRLPRRLVPAQLRHLDRRERGEPIAWTTSEQDPSGLRATLNIAGDGDRRSPGRRVREDALRRRIGLVLVVRRRPGSGNDDYFDGHTANCSARCTTRSVSTGQPSSERRSSPIRWFLQIERRTRPD